MQTSVCTSCNHVFGLTTIGGEQPFIYELDDYTREATVIFMITTTEWKWAAEVVATSWAHKSGPSSHQCLICAVIHSCEKRAAPSHCWSSMFHSDQANFATQSTGMWYWGQDVLTGVSSVGLPEKLNWISSGLALYRYSFLFHLPIQWIGLGNRWNKSRILRNKRMLLSKFSNIKALLQLTFQLLFYFLSFLYSMMLYWKRVKDGCKLPTAFLKKLFMYKELSLSFPLKFYVKHQY